MATTRPERDDIPAPASSAMLDANSDAREKYGRFNLAIIGGTGVGKSSLVNAVFGRDLARVGRGLPVTAGFDYYHDGNLGIWDFEGFEIGSQKPPRELVREGLARIAQQPPEEHIDVVWYCVLPHVGRLTEPDIEIIRELEEAGLPVIVVLTKVDWSRTPLGKHEPSLDAREFRDWLQRPVDHDERPLDIGFDRVVLTSTRDNNGKGTGHGLGELVEMTLALSPERGKDAFRIVQRLSLPMKRDLARPVIAAAAGAAALTAAVPLPIATAAALAPIQLGMMGRLAAVYDLDLKSMASATTLTQIGLQITGRAAARSLLKFIPGAGSVINASVAAALTAATGEGWRRLCERVYAGDLDISRVEDVIKDYAPTVVEVLKNLIGPKPATAASPSKA